MQKDASTTHWNIDPNTKTQHLPLSSDKLQELLSAQLIDELTTSNTVLPVAARPCLG